MNATLVNLYTIRQELLYVLRYPFLLNIFNVIEENGNIETSVIAVIRPDNDAATLDIKFFRAGGASGHGKT